MFCPKCGNELRGDYNVCPNCGTQIIRQTQPAYQQPQQAPVATTVRGNMTTWKLISGIISMVLCAILMLQSCLVGVGDVIAMDGSNGGAAGTIVALLMLCGGIVSVVVRKGGKGGNIALIALFGIAALIGFANADDFPDLSFWSIWCVACGALAIIALIRVKNR